MHQVLESVINRHGFLQGTDGVYSAPILASDSQLHERVIRERDAAKTYKNYLATTACNHSIPVMDKEVRLFLSKVPKNGLILDIGGCWGWHWRSLVAIRPDVSVLIIDFVRGNLTHAQQLLGSLIGTQVALLQADATALPFLNAGEDGFFGFDAIWSVQAIQHIPNFSLACTEAKRVLKRDGLFVNYSLHITPFNRMIYCIAGKKFHIEGFRDESYYLARATDQQRNLLTAIYGTKISERYTECLFHPDLKMTGSGRIGSFIGMLDSILSDLPKLGRWIARQRSFEVWKT